MAYTTPEFVASFQSEVDALVTDFQALKTEKDAELASIPDELEDLDIELRSIRLTANSAFSANNPAGAYNPYPNAASPGHLELVTNDRIDLITPNIELDASQTITIDGSSSVTITNGTVTITVSGSSVTVSGATTANFGAANITTTGNITGATVTGTTDVIADTINLKTHKHNAGTYDVNGVNGTTGSTSGDELPAHDHSFNITDGQLTVVGSSASAKNA